MIGIKAGTIGVVLLVAWASPALAFTCPNLASQVDAAIANASNLSTDQAEALKAQAEKGVAKHEAGNHSGSIAILRDVLKKLGQTGGTSSSGGGGYD